MAKNKKNKTTSVKEVDVIEETIDEEKFDDEEFEEVEEIIEDDDIDDDDDEVEDKEYEELSLEERIANIEKKTNATFWLVIVVLVVAALNMLFALNGDSTTTSSNGDATGDGSQSSEVSGGYDTSAFNTITADQIKDLSSGKTIVVWLGYQSCGYCQAYAPILAEVTKEYGITANYIDVQQLSEEGYNTVTSLSGSGEWAEFASTFTGTPFTLIIKNNKVIGGLKGANEASVIKAAFESAGITKK